MARDTPLWPQTFAERGVSVPFTSPSVAFSRIRIDDREDVEVLIPGLSGGRGVYIIPWRSMRDMFKLTVHDRILHEKIGKLKSVDPGKIRDASIEAALSGLAGPKVEAAAKSFQTRLSNDKLRIGLALIKSVSKHVVGTEIELKLADTLKPDGQKKLRGLMDQSAAKLGLNPGIFYERIETWSEAIAETGVASPSGKGAARRLVDRIEVFSETLEIWGEQTATANKELGPVLCELSQSTAAIVKQQFAILDRFLNAPGETLTRWEAAKVEIQSASEKVEWLLDGWPNLVGLWEASINEPPQVLDKIVGDLLRLLPLVPKSVLDSADLSQWEEFERFITAAPQQGNEKGSLLIDLDAMLVLEKTKIRSLI